MKVIFLAYRSWAIEVFEYLKNNPNLSQEMIICKSENELRNLSLTEYDLLITCGWSKELEDITQKILTIGVHCAELDRYSYGTPIQHQIIDNINFTKHRVFKFTESLNSSRSHTHTREYSHEVDLDLSGNIDQIFKQLTFTALHLFNLFLNDYPNIDWKTWPIENIKKSPRKPNDSSFSLKDISQKDTEEIYNIARCLESPYPNLCIEDDVGYLFIEKARFTKK
jgi:hypothetical protein